MLERADVLRRLWDLGHFRRPGDVDTAKVEDQAEAVSLEDSDTRALQAVASWQKFFQSDLDELCQAKHGRPALVDGLAGPATVELLERPRCAVPDFGLAEEANWPGDCRGRLVAGRAFPSLPGISKTDTDQVWWGCANNWTAALADVNITPTAVGTLPRERCDLWARLERLSGSTLAWHELARNSCHVTLDGAWDNRNWTKDFAVTTGTHEWGHALGLTHTNDRSGLMYPIINQASVNRLGWPAESDLAQCIRIGYRVDNPRRPSPTELWLPRSPGPPPPQPPPDDDMPDALRQLRVVLGGRRYYLVPEESTQA